MRWYLFFKGNFRWKVKVEYLVNTVAAPQRSRKGLDPTGPGQGKDGFLIPDPANSSSECQNSNGPLYQINWDTNFGGGTIEITAKAVINGVELTDIYSGKIEGQRFSEDPNFKTKIIEYLENPELAEGQTILATLGHPKFFHILAYKETLPQYRYEHFVPSIAAEPKGAVYPIENRKNLTGGGIGSDGGFGLMQLTNGKYLPMVFSVNGKTENLPSYEQIWNWKKNIEGGILIAKEKLEYATAYHDKHPVADSEKAEFLRWEVYQRYYGGHFWKWICEKDKTGKRQCLWRSVKSKKTKYGWEAKEIEEALANNNPPAGF